MAEENGPARDALSAVGRIAEAPGAWDFFAAVRMLQAARPDAAPVGASSRIEQDVLRFAQKPAMHFEPAELNALESFSSDTWLLHQSVLGFYGPNGPLPGHLTEEAIHMTAGGAAKASRERMLVDFCNMLQHRMTALLYRGWASANLAASRDRASHDAFLHCVDAAYGAALPGFAGRTALPDDTRRRMGGRLAEQRSSASVASGMATEILGSRVVARADRGEWLRLPRIEQSRLGGRSSAKPGVAAQLGRDALLGGRGYGVGTRLTLETEPLDLQTYRAAQPGGHLAAPLDSGLRHALGPTGAWTLRLALRRDTIPPCTLGGGVRLGRDTWIGNARKHGDRSNYTRNSKG